MEARLGKLEKQEGPQSRCRRWRFWASIPFSLRNTQVDGSLAREREASKKTPKNRITREWNDAEAKRITDRLRRERERTVKEPVVKGGNVEVLREEPSGSCTLQPFIDIGV